MLSGGTISHGATKHDSTVLAFNSSNFAGNSSANRAIPHGLGRAPNLVILTRRTDANDGTQVNIIHAGESGYIRNITSGTNNVLAVTAVDATNFYVGNATDYSDTGNLTGQTYYWVAL